MLVPLKSIAERFASSQLRQTMPATDGTGRFRPRSSSAECRTAGPDEPHQHHQPNGLIDAKEHQSVLADAVVGDIEPSRRRWLLDLRRDVNALTERTSSARLSRQFSLLVVLTVVMTLPPSA